jgi:hypothetical protein
VLQEFINETAEFFMKTYPQLKTGREYRKIGLALIKKYPCLAEKGNHLKPEVSNYTPPIDQHASVYQSGAALSQIIDQDA